MLTRAISANARLRIVVPFPDRVAHADARDKRQRKASSIVVRFGSVIGLLTLTRELSASARLPSW
jgi:hypothetical protein